MCFALNYGFGKNACYRVKALAIVTLVVCPTPHQPSHSHTTDCDTNCTTTLCVVAMDTFHCYVRACAAFVFMRVQFVTR